MSNYQLHQEIAEGLLFPLWECVDKKHKSAYPREVWGHFENFVRSSATSSSLAAFFGSFKKMCPFTPSVTREKAIAAFILGCDEDAVLDLLRSNECALIITLTTLKNEEAKAAYKESNNIQY